MIDTNIWTDANGAQRVNVTCVCLQELSLDHVFGYRGFDCRNNLHYLNDGADIIFHTAAAAIIQNLSAGRVSSASLC